MLPTVDHLERRNLTSRYTEHTADDTAARSLRETPLHLPTRPRLHGSKPSQRLRIDEERKNRAKRSPCTHPPHPARGSSTTTTGKRDRHEKNTTEITPFRWETTREDQSPRGSPRKPPSISPPAETMGSPPPPPMMKTGCLTHHAHNDPPTSPILQSSALSSPSLPSPLPRLHNRSDNLVCFACMHACFFAPRAGLTLLFFSAVCSPQGEGGLRACHACMRVAPLVYSCEGWCWASPPPLWGA